MLAESATNPGRCTAFWGAGSYGPSTYRAEQVSLVEATIEHSPAAVGLSGPALAEAMSGPARTRALEVDRRLQLPQHPRRLLCDLLGFARYANAHGVNILTASKADVAGFKAVLEDPDGGYLSPPRWPDASPP